MVLPRNKTKIKLVHRPASAGFHGYSDLSLSFGNTPDVTVLTAPINKLRQVVEATTKELEPYSRYVGRNPDARHALEGLLQLPATLWPEGAQKALHTMKARMDEGTAVMSFQELLGSLGAVTALTRDRTLALARALESLNIGIEPDVLGGAKLPKPGDKVVLFTVPPGEETDRLAPVYQVAVLTLDLASAVAAADGDFSAQEMGHLRALVQSWTHLTPNHVRRLLAHLHLLLMTPASLTALRKKLEPLDAGAKETIAAFMATVAQSDGASIGQLYAMFCASGAPFVGPSKSEFAELVRHLGQKELLMQESSGFLLHGRVGEKFVNHYTFYAAFAADEEFRIVCGGKTLGTLPVSQMLSVGQRILFAGRTWLVEDIEEEQKTIFVVRAGGGAPPLFSGGAGRTHTRVHQRMRQLLESFDMPPFLDEVAKRFLAEGRVNYAERNLANDFVIDQGREVVLLTWLGDNANEALACLLRRRGYTANAAGPGIEVLKRDSGTKGIVDALVDAAVDEPPPLDMLLADVSNLQREKWDWALPDGLLRKAYASLYLNIEEALSWASTLPVDHAFHRRESPR